MNGAPSEKPPARPCWSCEHFGGSSGEWDIAMCLHPKWGRHNGSPETGCVDWAASARPAMRLLVCGGRDYGDRSAAFKALDRVLTKKRVVLVIHGDCRGCDGRLRGGDRWADEWAESRGIDRRPCPADWIAHGKAAGPIRNSFMLTLRPDGILALPGGNGTDDMARQAEAEGVPVWRPYG